MLLSGGNKNDCEFAISALSRIKIQDSDILADKGYDTDAIVDYIYEHGAEPIIPSKSTRKFQRRCDWHLYKERHLVENFFLKIKNYRRVATRYDKLSFTFMGFVTIASILIWLH